MSDIFESIKLNLERTIQGLITKKSEFIYVDNGSFVPENKTYSAYYLTDKSKLYFTNLITSNYVRQLIRVNDFDLYEQYTNITSVNREVYPSNITLDVTDKDYTKGFVVRYFVKKANDINAKVEEFDFTYITRPKISGSCLVISSDLIKFGVNVPLCLLYNDDEGLSVMCEKLMGQNFIQFVCKNVLHVHARRHPQKRLYIKGEDNPHSFIGEKNKNFQKFLDLSKQNIQKLITGQGKFYEYHDLKNILETTK